jgi:hypothetical protein
MAAVATADQMTEGDEFNELGDDAASDDPSDEVSAASELADQPVSSPALESPLPAAKETSRAFHEEPVQVVSSTSERAPAAPESSPVNPIEPAEHSERPEPS